MIHTILALDADEHITALCRCPRSRLDGHFRDGDQARTHQAGDLEEFAAVRPSGLIAMWLEPDDTLDWVKYTDGDQDVILVTEQGQSIRFHESDVRVMGRPAGGVNAIKLADDDVVAGMDVVDEEPYAYAGGDRNGYGKRTIEEYRQQGRYGLGIRTLARNEKTGPIVSMRCINAKTTFCSSRA